MRPNASRTIDSAPRAVARTSTRPGDERGLSNLDDDPITQTVEPNGSCDRACHC